MRVVIYARFSSDLQDEKSITDQVAACRSRCEHEGWTVVSTFEDAAISGATNQRPSYNAMLQLCRSGAADIVMAEALDRLSRDQEETARVYKELSFQDIKLFTLQEGHVSELHIGASSLINSVFLKNLAEKTKRGQRGNIKMGKAAGGLGYGYRLRPHEPGVREINPDEARTVVRVFEQYVDGISPRTIALEFNRSGVAGTRGGKWTASTILGNPERGTGILNNETYIGRLVWNRLRYTRNPMTGKKVSKLNPPEQWEITEVPELRIIDQDLWDQAKARQQQIREGRKGRNMGADRRPKFLLSGLVKCGLCGSSVTTVATGGRLGCSRRKEHKDCDNQRTIPRARVEKVVLDALRDRLLSPDLVEVFVRAYIEELNQARRELNAERSSIESRLQGVTRKIEKIVSAIEDGAYSSSMNTRLAELEAEKRMYEIKMEDAAPVPETIVHPNAASIYRRKVKALETALRDQATHAAAAEALRGLIDKIALFPGEKRGEVDIEIVGELGAIMALMQAKKDQNPNIQDEVRVSLVAGVGFEPTTFRL